MCIGKPTYHIDLVLYTFRIAKDNQIALFIKISIAIQLPLIFMAWVNSWDEESCVSTLAIAYIGSMRGKACLGIASTTNGFEGAMFVNCPSKVCIFFTIANTGVVGTTTFFADISLQPWDKSQVTILLVGLIAQTEGTTLPGLEIELHSFVDGWYEAVVPFFADVLPNHKRLFLWQIF